MMGAEPDIRSGLSRDVRADERKGMGMSNTRQNARQAAPLRRAARLMPEERREQLLACALKVFGEHGIAGANHALIARAARVSVPTVFFYFKTREALVNAVLGEVERFYTEIFASATRVRGPAIEALNQLTLTLNRTLDASLAVADYTRILREWSVAVRSPIWPRYLRLYRRITQTFSKLIARGQREGDLRSDIDPDDEAVILAAVSSALYQMMETGAGAEQTERLRSSVMRSLLPPGQEPPPS
jgi:TetR/AcrR family hemagglutinin/protease transcriptional regulator